MVNIIWLVMLLAGLIFGIINGRVDEVTSAVFSASGEAVNTCINIVGVLALWMGILKIAENSGIVKTVAKIMTPFIRWLFPDVPRDHPALGAIVMNLGANILGLGNAATPFGLKAMEDLQKLNTDKNTASPAMITFLALNTSCITIIPASIISLRVQAGSANPTEIVAAAILATAAGTVVAISIDRILRHRFYRCNK